MKKLIAFSMVAFFVCAFSLPVLAETLTNDVTDNLNDTGKHVSDGWHGVLDSVHTEASKGRNTGEQVAGVAVGGVVGARKAIHHLGAGAINVLTFWIPKKQPLISETSTK
ncbi:MAG: hypothetical protein HYZ87_01115 [Candidatus Omnitrophica bacterium]|nr:hypothetical protein [Candidatus Omnitrophota bacterium]